MRFIEPMLLLATEQLPSGAQWLYELKLDGFRAQGIKTGGRIQLRSRNDKDFSRKYPAIAKALAAMPDDTVIDGEIVALDEAGKPSFSALQNGSGVSPWSELNGRSNWQGRYEADAPLDVDNTLKLLLW